jgi:hypothetical protein
LSEASSFCLAEKSAGVGKKVQTANFLCFVSFVRAKEMKSLRGLSESKAFKPLRRLSNSKALKPAAHERKPFAAIEQKAQAATERPLLLI